MSIEFGRYSDNPFSNESLANHLDSLEWRFDDYFKAEVIQLHKVFEDSILLGLFLKSNDVRGFKLFDVTYAIRDGMLMRDHSGLAEQKQRVRLAEKQPKRTYNATPINRGAI